MSAHSQNNDNSESQNNSKPADCLLKYLSDQRAHFQNYHNHKENCAWAGVVVSIAIAAELAKIGVGLGCLERKLVILACLAVICIVEFVFVYEQFRLRSFAGYALSSAQALMTLALSGKSPKQDGWDFELRTSASDSKSIGSKTINWEDHLIPYLIECCNFIIFGVNRLAQCEDNSISATKDLPAFFRAKISEMSATKLILRLRLEQLAFALMILTNITAAIAIWWGVKN